MATAVEAWAATGSWRGDLKLFARIVDKAVREVGSRGQPGSARIEFAVRDDLEVFGSADELLEKVPASTLRSFSSARIQVGDPGLAVEVRFGRKKPSADAALACPLGVGVDVSSDGTVAPAEVEAVRTAVSRVVARGGFSWVQLMEGPSESAPDLDDAQAGRWRERGFWTQVIVGLVTIVVLAITAALMILTAGGGDQGVGLMGLLSSLILVSAVVAAVQLAFFKVSLLIFPAIEIADTTPGRRWLKLIGGSGAISAVFSVLAALAKGGLG